MANSENFNQTLKKQEYTLLLIDDESSAKDRLELALADCGRGLATKDQLKILHAPNLAIALDFLSGNQIHIALLDKNLGSDVALEDQNGIEAIPDMLRLQPHLQILVMTGSGSISDVVRAMDLGAASFIQKEKPDELLISQMNRLLQNSLVRIQAARSERGLLSEAQTLGGKSKIFQRTLKNAELVAITDLPVILYGESGTGKTELAKWIHKIRAVSLKQKDSPFFGINMAALSKEVIENELFGHEKGAFTDAHESKPGLFELAENGTLFLDEIGELPLEIQPKLLKVIDEKVFMKVGGKKILTTNAKLVFATHRDLQKMVRDGLFREDLYMRISGFPIQMPSLSERRQDIPEIIRALLPKACSANRVFVQFEDLPQDFIDYLVQTPVNGNIRGIQHQLERLLVFAPKDKHGKPVLSRWKTIPGFSARSNESEHNSKLENDPLTYSELMRRPWNILGNEFPGLKEAIDAFRSKIIAEAKCKFKTNRERAKILKIAESTSSTESKVHGSKKRSSDRNSNEKSHLN